MHVAMLIGALGKGGSERVMVNLADYLIGQGDKVTIVTQYQKENEYALNPQAQRVISDIGGDQVTGSRVRNFYRRFMKLRKIWKAEKPDVILSFIGKNNMMAILTSRFLDIPVAVAVRGEPTAEYYNRWMRVAARSLFLLADGIILQTCRSGEFFPEGVRRKAVILKNPVNPAFFRERYEGEREKSIVAVGRVDENKNHEMLIRAFAEIAEEFPEYCLKIYGEGELRKPLQDLAGEMGLENRIFLPGSVDGVADVIYRAEIFVLSSDTEGVPNTLIEAMVMGVPVVATDCPCGGPADLIVHGKNGLLTPVRNVEKMKENLQNSLKNLQNREKMGKEAYKLRWEYMSKSVENSWKEYLKSLI